MQVYFLQHEFLKVGHLPEKGNAWQLSSGFEGRTIGDYMVSDILLKMCTSHVIILLEDFMIENGVGQSFNLMPRHFQFALYVSYIFFSEESSPVLINLGFIHSLFDFGEIEQACSQQQLQLFIVPEALILEAGDLCCNFKAVLILQRYLIHEIEQLFPMPCFLIRRQYKYLTNSVPLLHCGQPKHIFREQPHHIFSFFSFYLFINHIIDPGIKFLEDERDAINIEKQEHLESLLEWDECLIIAEVLHQLELVLSSCIAMHELTLRLFEVLLFLLALEPVLPLSKSLPPSFEGDPVVTLIVFEDILQGFRVFGAQFACLDLLWILELDPVVQGGAEKVKDELRSLCHRFFVNFVGEDLIEIV